MIGFPQQIYVQQNDLNEPCNNYLLAHETKEDVTNADLEFGEAGEHVAVYEFVKLVKIKQRTSYVETEIVEVKQL